MPRTLIAAASLLVLVIAGCASAPTAPPTPAAPSADAPAGLRPLSDERQSRLASLVDTTVELRGLSARETLLTGQQGPDELKSFFRDELDAELSEEELSHQQRILDWFRLIPDGLVLRDYYIDLMSSQVAGYFDPDTGYLVMVDGDTTDFEGTGMSPLLAEHMDNATLVHEINHALQHQHFDLDRIMGTVDGLSDGSAAAAALVEGDSMLVMYSFMLGARFERFDTAQIIMEQMFADPRELIELSPDLPGSEELLQAPAYMRETLLFPYTWGLRFAWTIQSAGGQKLMDHAFLTDPPVSTEQILHPEKWLTERDQPQDIDLPASVDRLTGIYTDSWGEFGIRLVLAERLPQLSYEALSDIAAGWGGDRYALYRDGDDEALAWVTEWDTPEDADAFVAAANAGFAGWRSERVTPTRIVLLDTTAGVRADEADALFGVAVDAYAAKVRGSAPDFAAIGITDDDIPTPMSVSEYMTLMQDPVMSELFAVGADVLTDEDMERFMENPEMAARMEEMVEELLEDPEEADRLAEQMLAMQGPLPDIAVSDGLLTIDELAFSMSLPTGPDWQVQQTDSPPTTVATHATDGGMLVVALSPMPPYVPLKSVAAGIEHQMRSTGAIIEGRELTELAGRETYTLGMRDNQVGYSSNVWIIRISEFGVVVNVVVPDSASSETSAELYDAVGAIRVDAARRKRLNR